MTTTTRKPRGRKGPRPRRTGADLLTAADTPEAQAEAMKGMRAAGASYSQMATAMGVVPMTAQKPIPQADPGGGVMTTGPTPGTSPTMQARTKGWRTTSTTPPPSPTSWTNSTPATSTQRSERWWRPRWTTLALYHRQISDMAKAALLPRANCRRCGGPIVRLPEEFQGHPLISGGWWDVNEEDAGHRDRSCRGASFSRDGSVDESLGRDWKAAPPPGYKEVSRSSRFRELTNEPPVYPGGLSLGRYTAHYPRPQEPPGAPRGPGAPSGPPGASENEGRAPGRLWGSFGHDLGVLRPRVLRLGPPGSLPGGLGVGLWCGTSTAFTSMGWRNPGSGWGCGGGGRRVPLGGQEATSSLGTGTPSAWARWATARACLIVGTRHVTGGGCSGGSSGGRSGGRGPAHGVIPAQEVPRRLASPHTCLSSPHAPNRGPGPTGLGGPPPPTWSGGSPPPPPAPPRSPS